MIVFDPVSLVALLLLFVGWCAVAWFANRRPPRSNA